MKKLDELMIKQTATIKESMKQLSINAMQILLVVDKGGKLVGTVTDGDIRRGLLDGLRFNDIIDKVMYRDFISLKSDAKDIKSQAQKLMVENKIEQIPIVDENSRVIDIILWTDLFEMEGVKQSEKLPNQVIIMAGGKGTRLDPFTRVFPKPLIPLGDKTVIEIIMEKFYQYGFYKFTYTINYKKEYVKLFLKENNFPYSIDWIEEEDFLGTAGSISLLKNKITDTFFVANCDTLLDVNFEEVLGWHKEHRASITIVGCHNEVKIPFGVLQLEKGKLAKISEKPVHDVLVNTGVYVMEHHIISYIPEGGKMDMNELIEVVAKKEKVSVYPIYGGWVDIGQWRGMPGEV